MNKNQLHKTNTMKAEHFEKLKTMFNGIRPLRGELVGFATHDPDGYPNIAPVGSMRVVDEHTIHVLQGMLPRTMANLRKNPGAVFCVWKRPTLGGILKSVAGKEDGCAGYRVYAQFIEEVDDPDAIEREFCHILPRIPWVARRPMKQFFRKNLRKLLRFSIEEIREIG